MKRIIIIITITILCFSYIGCNDNLLQKLPNDRLTSDIFWRTAQDAIVASNAIYAELPGTNIFTNWDAMSDIGHVTLQWRDESIMEKGAFDATIAPVLARWKHAYGAIRKANVFLANIGKVKANSAELKDRLTGEVKVLRAFFYIRLAMLFGDIPLIKKVITLEESRKISRTPLDSVWDFISDELSDAVSKLPLHQDQVGRITKGTALALKARAMLYAGHFSEAEKAAKQVIDLHVYKLYPSYENLFTYAAEDNNGVIFDRQYIKGVESNNIFALTTPNSLYPQANSFVPTKKIVDAYYMVNGKPITDPNSGFDPYNPYENRDPRLKYSIYVPGSVLPNGEIYNPLPGSGTGDEVGSSENSTATGFNTRKYINKEDMSEPYNSGINIIYIRYAEVLLTYAEAKIELNEIDQSVLDAINQIRQRPDVSMPILKEIKPQNEMRKIVRHERLVEFAFEGLRYFDIRRWKIAENVMPGVIKGMTYKDQDGHLQTVSISGFNRAFPKKDYLWPIPYNEIKLNPNLTQNSGW